ncbi:MAG: hypothetical protein R3E39_01530 [Anaerolineae bacterium]
MRGNPPSSIAGQVRWHYLSGSTTEPPAYPQADCLTVPPSASSRVVERCGSTRWRIQQEQRE